ncbi:MAG: HAMP domain-containing histidine kinase [Ruminococcaceae bacterium]|nr:HAMP domain-containing histidine kinase [Oscillospiraceae bacterium]
MIEQAKRKFIATSMISVLVLLVVVMLGVNVLNYFTLIQESDMILLLLERNRGHFPSDKQNASTDVLPEHLSPETPYETRYFTVSANRAGEILKTDLGHIASVDSATAASYAARALARGEKRGFLDRFRFVRSESEEGYSMIFLDCGGVLSDFYTFAWAGVIMSLIGYALVFCALVVFSDRIVQPVRESYEKQKRFITDAGHEIKTPLAVINANADLWEMEYGTNPYLDEVKLQTKQLSDLTHRLVYLAKMEENDASMKMTDFCLSDLVSDTAGSFRALAQARERAFLCSVEPLLTVCGNEGAIGQLVTILLDNALKYSSEGGAVGVLLRRHGREIRLKVWNSVASPVTEEQLSHFFDRFYRTDASRNSKTGGYGIGLSIAKAIVEAHRGKIKASLGGNGSVELNVTLPAA